MNQVVLIKLKDILTDEFLKLIWEHKEVDWSKVTVETKVLVSDVSSAKEISTWEYCKLAEESKEEVAFDDIDKEMDEYCNKHSEICKQECSICVMKYILENYNVTRKESK